MKVIYFAHNEWEAQYMQPLLSGMDIKVYVGPIQDHADITDEDADVVSVFVDSALDEAALSRFPKLKLIATRSTGFDHIDMNAVRARGVAVATVPAYGQNTVAEFAFALLLALSRRVCDAHERVSREGRFTQEGLEGFDLLGKTIGIVGCGRIGVHMAGIAKGFGMDVVVYDAHQDPEMAQRYGFTYVSLDDLFGKADVISIHVPYMESTHHLINLGNIQNIKRGAYLINTARGAVVETAAIIEALKQGILAGAGLDVLEEEGDMAHEEELLLPNAAQALKMQTMLANHYLMEHPRVIVTPHVAFDTHEAIQRILGTTAENIRAFVDGQPKNIVAQ